MTTAQARRLYFPAWTRALQANWVVDRGMPVRREGRASAELVAIETAALALARQRCGRVSAEDLRHACGIVALGHGRSSKEFTDAELDRMVAFFGRLADGDDLKAVIAWEHPEQDARRRVVWAVEHAGFPEAYVRAICRAKFGTLNWRALDDRRLRQLMVTLKARARARRARTPVAEAKAD